MNTQKSVELVHIHKGKVFTDSLMIAKEFGKRPSYVNDKIKSGLNSSDDEILKFSLHNFLQSDYKNTRGKEYEKYEVTEDGFAELAMSFTGEKARKIRIRFLNAFRKALNEIDRLRNDPDRKQAIRDKRDTARPMTDGLVFVRDMLGKKTDKHHCSNEHKFCNRALTGEWKPIDETELDTYDLRLLKAIRERNTLLIQHYPVQKDRKELMDKFVAEYREKHPRLKLVS